MTMLGQRIRRMREVRNLTQAQLARALPLSGSYLSLIETGKRTPRPHTLKLIADQLGCTVEYLWTGRDDAETADIDLELRFAELALKSADAEVARDRFQQVLSRAAELGYEDAADDARWGLCRAQAALGELESAAEGLHSLVEQEVLRGGVHRASVSTEWCRVLLKLGDVARAIEVGEAALALSKSDDEPIADDIVELMSTLVFCYYERGDLATARCYAEDLVQRADRGRSPKARAAAYWNAGIVAEARGELAKARLYTDRALALYSEDDNDRRTAQVRVSCAIVLLREPEPDWRRAAELLERAVDELRSVGTPRDVACAQTELGRCALMAGDPGRALELATEALVLLAADHSLERSRALAVRAAAHAAMGHVDEVLTAYRSASADLLGLAGSRHAASVWRDFAALLAASGQAGTAITAYERALEAAAVGSSMLHVQVSDTAARRNDGRQ